MRRRRIFASAAAVAVVASGAMTVALRPAYAAMACTVDYTVTREWSNGWMAELTLTNLGAPATDWYLRFQVVGSGQAITYGYDQLPPGYRLGSGEMFPAYLLRPPAGDTLATGGSVTVRFGGNFSTDHPVLGSPNPAPKDYVFAGQPCNVDLPVTGSPPSSQSPSPSPAPVRPTVALTSPLHNDVFAASGAIPIRADATATAGRRIERVEFRERGTLLGIDTTAPYSFDWRGAPPNSGTRITATAYDSTGASATAEVRGVRVLSPPAPGAAPPLKVSGSRIGTVERHPRPYQPRGIVRTAAEMACGAGPIVWDGPVDDAAVRALRASGVNAVRMALDDACWRSVSEREDRNAYVADVAAYADRLIRHGITPIVSLRADADTAASFWSAMALRFGDDNAVVLDLTSTSAPAVGENDADLAWSCWREVLPGCYEAGYRGRGVREQIRLLRLHGAFNVILAGGLDGGNDVSGWLAHRPPDPDGRNLAAAWRVDNRAACATVACWEATLLPLAAEVPVVATDVTADGTAPAFVPRTLSWLQRHGIGHVRR